jgi:hypothetical protein
MKWCIRLSTSRRKASSSIVLDGALFDDEAAVHHDAVHAAGGFSADELPRRAITILSYKALSHLFAHY